MIFLTRAVRRVLFEPALYRLGIFITTCVLSVGLLLNGLALALQFDTGHIMQYARNHHGERVAARVADWLALMENSAALPERERLRAVNDFWNRRVRGGDDIHIWDKADYWATPLETLSQGAGDCEDFVIAKYFSLIRAGVDPQKLRFIYVRARIGTVGGGETIAHMVLGYYPTPDAEPLVLDNLSSSIVAVSRRSDLTPVFSFNAQGIYVAGAATRSVDRIGHWRDLMARMQQEGFTP